MVVEVLTLTLRVLGVAWRNCKGFESLWEELWELEVAGRLCGGWRSLGGAVMVGGRLEEPPALYKGMQTITVFLRQTLRLPLEGDIIILSRFYF